VQIAVPGTDTYGVRDGGRGPEPAGAALREENAWSTERYLDFIPAVFARCARSSARS
jgi:hypothetical protein